MKTTATHATVASLLLLVGCGGASSAAPPRSTTPAMPQGEIDDASEASANDGEEDEWQSALCPARGDGDGLGALAASCRDFLPLPVIAAWPADVPLPNSTLGMNAPDGCVIGQGQNTIVRACRLASGSGVALERFDVAAQHFVPVGTLAGAIPLRGASVIDSVGSHAFAVQYFVHGADGDSAAYALVANEIVPIAERPELVHDALAVVRRGDDGHLELVRLPALETIPLGLSSEAPPPVQIGFRPDGALLVVVPPVDWGGESTLYVGAPGAWEVHALPARTDAVAMADGDHGLASSPEALSSTNDGGETWDTVVEASDRAVDTFPPVCVPSGCAMMHAATFGALPDGAALDENGAAEDGSDDALDLPSGNWNYTAEDWRCTPPARTTWRDTDGRRTYAPWGWLDHSDVPAGQTEITWTAIDARGVVRMHATPPAELHTRRALVTTRQVAIVSTITGLTVLSARSHEVDFTTLTSWYDAGSASFVVGVLPTGESLVLVIDGGVSIRPHAELLLHFDAEGALLASHVYWWRGTPPRLSGVAFGPNGVVGRAVGGDDAGWLVFPIDGGDPIEVASPTTLAPCGAGTRAWSITVETGPIALRYETTMYESTNVIEIGDDTACVSAVLPAQAIRGTAEGSLFEPVLFGERGAVRGLGVDDSRRGVTLHCAVSSD